MLDIEGNQREVIDAKDRVVMRYDYDMLGNRIHRPAWRRRALDAERRRRQADPRLGQPRTTASAPPTTRCAGPLRLVRDGDEANDPAEQILFERTVYGEGQPDTRLESCAAQVVQVFDGAGIVTSDDYDFKGNLLRGSRQLTQRLQGRPSTGRSSIRPCESKSSRAARSTTRSTAR